MAKGVCASSKKKKSASSIKSWRVANGEQIGNVAKWGNTGIVTQWGSMGCDKMGILRCDKWERIGVVTKCDKKWGL